MKQYIIMKPFDKIRFHFVPNCVIIIRKLNEYRVEFIILVTQPRNAVLNLILTFTAMNLFQHVEDNQKFWHKFSNLEKLRCPTKSKNVPGRSEANKKVHYSSCCVYGHILDYIGLLDPISSVYGR